MKKAEPKILEDKIPEHNKKEITEEKTRVEGYARDIVANRKRYGLSEDAASRTARFIQEEPTPEEDEKFSAHAYAEFLDAAHWFSLRAVEPSTAALLLCKFDPRADTLETALLSENDEVRPDDLSRLVERFEDQSKSDPQRRSLAQWIQLARSLKLGYHSWVDVYVRAAGIDVADPPAVPTSPLPIQRTLTTAEVADAFDEIDGLSAKKWRDKLGDVKNHQWLIPARATQGKAPNPSTWYPLKIAELLLERNVTLDALNRIFLTTPALKPWLAEWQESKRQRNAFGK